MRQSADALGKGSSPLARGGPQRDAEDALDGGLIPARAGRTASRSASRSSIPAHPRSRGADARGVVVTLRHGGSSPLARGGRCDRLSGAAALRLIPARAGRTRLPGEAWTEREAHPRSRGADLSEARKMAPDEGSSPLARGGPVIIADSLPEDRLIPARAGRTASSNPSGQGEGAHPRSRGADRKGNRVVVVGAGSSPLARGGPALSTQPTGSGRLIPARAGRTSAGSGRSRRPQAHPRSRGADALPQESDEA